MKKLSNLCINFYDIPDQGLEFDLKEDFSNLDIEAKDFNIKEPISIRGTIKKFGKDLYVKGHLLTEMIMCCSRCIENFTYTLDTGFEATYIPLGNELLEEERELNHKDLDILFYKDEKIDLRDVVRDQIVLSVPLKSLCKADCLGLCPKCGQNLNISKCDCTLEDVDPRLEVLKKLKRKN